MITLITCTGMRPEAFALCERWMLNQSHHDVTDKDEVQWIVVDDGYPKTECTLGQLYVRGPTEWHLGYNTQRDNMNTAFNLIDKASEYIFFIEDDDYYAPGYLYNALNELQKGADIVGQADAVYYNVANPSYLNMRNYTSASLCQTGIKKSLLPILYESINDGDKYFDLQLWKRAKDFKKSIYSSRFSVGMKNMPGRSGIGYGHSELAKYRPDPKYLELQLLVGKEVVEVYKGFKR